MCVGTAALVVSLVSSIATVRRVKLVVILIRNVPQLVLELENRATTVVTVQLVNLAVVLIGNVRQLVLEYRVATMATALLENVVTLMANVIQEIAM
jgi:hypothetical protein